MSSIPNNKNHPQTFNIDEIQLKLSSYILRILAKKNIKYIHDQILSQNSVAK